MPDRPRAGCVCATGVARAEAVLTEDGIYREPWFLESFLELADDLAAAGREEEAACHHVGAAGLPLLQGNALVNFAKPEITNFIKDRFEMLQLNIIGSREVTDFDGQKLPEKALAQKYGVRYTPTFQFFPDSVAGLAEKAPREREVARVQGYLEPAAFLAMFRFVSERAYEKGEPAGLSQERTAQPTFR